MTYYLYLREPKPLYPIDLGPERAPGTGATAPTQYHGRIFGIEMAKIINEDTCIQCGSCITVCPNEGISETDDGGYRIDPALCTECAGMFSESQCAAACPVDAIEDDPDHVEDAETLIARAADLHPGAIPRD
jgi:ferredoxin